MYNDKDNKHYLIIDNTMDLHSTIEHKELMYSIYILMYLLMMKGVTVYRIGLYFMLFSLILDIF